MYLKFFHTRDQSLVRWDFVVEAANKCSGEPSCILNHPLPLQRQFSIRKIGRIEPKKEYDYFPRPELFQPRFYGALYHRAPFFVTCFINRKTFFLNTFYVSSYWIYFFLFKIKMACLSHPFRYKRIMEIPNIIVICSRSEKKIWHSVRFKFWIWAILELQFNSTYNKHIGYAVRVTKFQNFFVSPPLEWTKN